MNEPTISYEGLCDILEQRNPELQISPQALCETLEKIAQTKSQHGVPSPSKPLIWTALQIWGILSQLTQASCA